MCNNRVRMKWSFPNPLSEYSFSFLHFFSLTVFIETVNVTKIKEMVAYCTFILQGFQNSFEQLLFLIAASCRIVLFIFLLVYD